MSPLPSRPGRTRPLEVAVIGAGAIGGAVAAALQDGEAPGARLAAVLRSTSTAAEIDRAVENADVVVEASSVEAAELYIPRVTAAGKDIIVCSCGVFARHQNPHDLIAGARPDAAGSGETGPASARPGRVLVPAGAIGGLDVLSAAARAGTEQAEIRHITIKSPAALVVVDPLTAPREVFRGSARRAALEFPRTSNASVALALATLGLDRTEVVVVADPDVERTRHIVEWRSPLGKYDLSFENALDPDSGGRTSAITAWSVAEVLVSLRDGVGPGVVVMEATGPMGERADGPVEGGAAGA